MPLTGVRYAVSVYMPLVMSGTGTSTIKVIHLSSNHCLFAHSNRGSRIGFIPNRNGLHGLVQSTSAGA